MAESPVSVRRPLLDRLIDEEPASNREVRPLRSLSRRELKESVRRELERLMNTRTSIPARQLLDRELTVIDYGIPDFSTFSGGNPADLQRLGAILTRVVEAFEPRLQKVEIVVKSYTSHNQSVVADLAGILVVDRIAEPVSFPFLIEGREGESRVDAAP